MMKRWFFLWVMLFLGGQPVQAGGFMIGEMATRSSGMGSAFTAVADDASAAWHNPAGVVFTEGTQLMLGGDALIVSGSSYASNSSTKGAGGVPITNAVDGISKTFYIPHTYYTYMSESSDLGASISVNAPFGLESDWPTTSSFNTKNTYSRIQMLMINPSVAFKLSENFSMAVGFDYAYVKNVDLNNTLQDLNGNGDGWGGNASLLYKTEAFSLGVNYRSKITVAIDGVARAKSTLAALGGTTSTGITKLTFPDQLNVGLAFKVSDTLLLSADVDWVNWKTYDTIDINYGSAAYRTALSALQGLVSAPVTGSTHLPQNWKATTAFRIGSEWAYRSDMRFRFGYVYDPTPVTDVDFSPSVPDNDKQVFSLGYGYDLNEHATLDVAYAYVYFKNRDQTASPATPTGSPNTVKNGSYRTNIHILAVSLAYKL